MNTIDLRSDTVTKPSAAMLKAMVNAELGDDVYGEDPTINALESIAAEITGKQDALFCTSGTQSNLLALLSHCQRGDEMIVGAHAHCYLFEAGGAAVLGGIQSQTIENEADGTLDLNKVRKAIKPDDNHFAMTKLLCIENTTSGLVLPTSYLDSLADFADNHGLKTHLDGARLFNAAVASGETPARLCQSFDSVSFCLSKGLSAPVGSLLCASEQLIAKARRQRKMLGGGLRQAGMLAAAGIYALQNNIERLQQDHDKVAALAKRLAGIEQITISSAETNIIFVRVAQGIGASLTNALHQQGIAISASPTDADHLRLVTHIDVSEENIQQVAKAIEDFFDC